jgi:peptidoglycan/LPS O-acetylase OafA/YrhL
VIAVHTTFASGFTGRYQGSFGNYTSRLEIGVAVFFIISGFLLYRPFAAAHFEGRPRLEARAFWVRRLKRIVPAYWAAFLIVSYVIHADTVRHAWFSPLVYLTFAQIYSPRYALTGITQAWSLCTEMTFYLALPLYAGLFDRRPRTPDRQLRLELGGLGALVAASFAFRIPVLLGHSQVAHTMPNWLPAYADVFALGMFLAVISSWLSVNQLRPAWLWHPLLPWASWLLAGGAFVAVSNIGLPFPPIAVLSIGPSLGRQALYGLFGFFMVAPAVFGPQDRGLIRHALRWRPVVLIGVVSYGVYLWHESWMNMYLRWVADKPFTAALLSMTAAVTALAIAAASISYIVIERPVLRGRLPVLDLPHLGYARAVSQLPRWGRARVPGDPAETSGSPAPARVSAAGVAR